MIDALTLAKIVGERNPVEEAKPNATKKRIPADDTADVRDLISGFVGKGYTNLKDQESKVMFNRMSDLIGQEKAQKLVSHIFVQNQRPSKKPVEARIMDFYQAPSGDKAVDALVKESKGFGYGPLDGFRNSNYILNSQLQGKSFADGKNPANASDAVKIAAIKKISL